MANINIHSIRIPILRSIKVKLSNVDTPLSDDFCTKTSHKHNFCWICVENFEIKKGNENSLLINLKNKSGLSTEHLLLLSCQSAGCHGVWCAYTHILNGNWQLITTHKTPTISILCLSLYILFDSNLINWINFPNFE